ncbi:MAG: hypothetical protein M1549_01225 [Candidatus Dependentiae bacterium]|nr:hypothetical protein [Candidatus Dependentiae bacterium]
MGIRSRLVLISLFLVSSPHLFGEAKFSSRLKLEGFYSRNGRLLNTCNGGLDKLVWQKYTWDPKFLQSFPNDACGWDAATFVTNLRCKGTFGSPESAYRTAPTTIKDDAVILGSHSHPLTINLPIVRELWLEFTINDALGLHFKHRHTFIMGLFPFQLGRGISLGQAYATMPDVTGYDPASSVDSYAPGFKFSGSIADGGRCDYDIYAIILSNRSDRFDAVNEEILGSIYGHQLNQARGFGKINYIIASRLKCQVVDEEDYRIYLEPYALLDDEREQRIELRGDADSKLGTLGLVGEFRFGDLDFGFETAMNVGKQHVHGIDRNVIKKEIRSISYNGDILGTAHTYVNSKVSAVADNPDTGDTAGKKALYVPDNQAIIVSQMINSMPDSSLAVYNGQIIPNPSGGGLSNLKNAADRFRDPYVNTFDGSMFVFDATYYVRRPYLRLSACCGLATGDEAPNVDLDRLNDAAVSGDYKGFMSLQELYNGTRVRSEFLLGGKGQIPRLLSFPTGNIGGGYPQAVTHFTNLIFTGAGCTWSREAREQMWRINPNILGFWEQYPTRLVNSNGTTTLARPYLGTEVNAYIDVLIFEGLSCSILAGFFVPGGFYRDTKGRPISAKEVAQLEKKDQVDYVPVNVPTLGDDNAFFVSAGFDYRF